MSTVDDIRIRFDDFGLSHDARAMVLALDDLTDAERTGMGELGQSPRAAEVYALIGRLPESEWLAVVWFLEAVKAARSAS